MRVGISPEDVFEEKNYILLKSALSFNPKKNVKFSTWLGNYAKFTCLNMMNSKRNIFNSEVEELHEYIKDSQPAPEEPRSYLEEMSMVFAILEKFRDSRIIEVFRMRYFSSSKKESRWKNISGKLNISIQTSINLHRRGLSLLKNQLKEKINVDKE